MIEILYFMYKTPLGLGDVFMRQPKNRADLKFEPLNLPEPVELDYSNDITEKDLRAMRDAMPDEALEDGILISGDRR